MKTLTFLLAAFLFVAGAAYAQKVEPLEQEEITGSLVRDNCDTYGYDAYVGNPGGLVPDNDASGMFFGPVPTVDNGTIVDVILAVNISHTWIGDLRMSLFYDVDCDYYLEAEGQVLCRHTLDGCPPDGCCGCAGDLDGWYGFDDVGATSIEDICPSVFPTGCYGPDYDSVGLDVFDGMPSGGCFWLWVADGAGGDEAEIYEWNVFVLTEDVEPVTGTVDFKPGSCPNPLNVKSRGVLPVAILTTEGFDAMLIDPESVRFACTVPPLRWSWSDVATPVGPDAEPCECNELGGDGFTDLTLKFSTQEVVAALGDVDDGDEVSVAVTGTLFDGTSFAFHDCLWIIDKTRDPTRTAPGAPDISATLKEPTEPSTWGTIKALYR